MIASIVLYMKERLNNNLALVSNSIDFFLLSCSLFLVQESCHIWNCIFVVSASSALVFFKLLGMPHVLSEVGVEGEDGVVLG